MKNAEAHILVVRHMQFPPRGSHMSVALLLVDTTVKWRSIFTGAKAKQRQEVIQHFWAEWSFVSRPEHVTAES